MAANAHHSNLQLQVEQHPLVDDQCFPSMEAYVIHLIHLKAYEEAARLVAGKTVLDMGCNIGYGLEVLASTAFSVAGLDVSPRAVAAAQQRLGPTVDIRVYNGTLCSFASRSFDAVTSFQVIEHVSDYTAYFSEIVRLIRPGGMVLFTTPNARLRLDPGMKPWNEFHVREFTPPELKELLSTWFELVELRGLFGKDELYQLECNRCARAKNAPKPQPARIHPTLRKTLKRVFPWLIPIRKTLRAGLKREHDPVNVARSEMKCFSTQDLFYRADRLEDALDLMALCRKPVNLSREG